MEGVVVIEALKQYLDERGKLLQDRIKSMAFDHPERHIQLARLAELQGVTNRVALLAVAGAWHEKVEQEAARVGRKLTLDELLSLARTHNMTQEEREAQRQSWLRQMKD